MQSRQQIAASERLRIENGAQSVLFQLSRSLCGFVAWQAVYFKLFRPSSPQRENHSTYIEDIDSS
jgi:hypothetical protein